MVLSGILKQIGGGKYYTEMLKQLGSRGYWNGKASDIRAEVEKIIRKVERGEALTEKQAALEDMIASEGTSIMAELALGNEHFARELLDADASIVEKLLNRIAEVKEALARRKDAEAKKAFEELRVAEGYFLEALAERGLAFVDGKIVGAREEEEKKVQYSLREQFSSEFDAWMNEKNDKERLVAGGYFEIGKTSDALKSIGMRDAKIYWRKSKIQYTMEDHPAITPEIVKKCRALSKTLSSL